MKSTLQGLLLALICTTLQAEPYVVGTGSVAQIKTKDGTSDSTHAFALGAGWRFNKYFAAEADYLKTGSVTGQDAPRVQGGSTFTTSHFFDMKGFGLSAIGSWPVVEKVSLLGKVGAHRLTLKNTTQTLQTTPGGSFIDVQASTTQETAWVPSLALGAEFAPVQEVRFRAMLEQTAGHGALDGMRMLSLSAIFSF